MAKLSRLPGRAERQAQRDLRVQAELVEAVALSGLFQPELVDALHRHVKLKRSAQEGWRYMQVNAKREDEIIAALRHHTPAWREATDVLRAVRACLTLEDQRTAKTQAEIAKDLDLRTTNAARAFRALEAVGAIMNPVQAGKSRTWEVDATFATMLDSDTRAAVAARQAEEKKAQSDASASGDAASKTRPRRQARPTMRVIEGGMKGIE